MKNNKRTVNIMYKTNKNTYLVSSAEFNSKAPKLCIFVSYVGKYSVTMVAKVADFIYIGINFYSEGEYVEFLVNNRDELIDYVESNFIGRWEE